MIFFINSYEHICIWFRIFLTVLISLFELTTCPWSWQYFLLILTGCECNYGGSFDNLCHKKNGACSCKRNVGGTKCDRYERKFGFTFWRKLRVFSCLQSWRFILNLKFVFVVVVALPTYSWKSPIWRRRRREPNEITKTSGTEMDFGHKHERKAHALVTVLILILTF